ncbi:unnamed protein product [Paramecium primaurelia]|uniref:Cyclic nucleotide-binding domain-containing protein n=1 Tax=Paramecium primaurelia TaxID=5886 RepID=A0A8S1M0Q4_PARPR|nr:unnamed protein product [Paramecium primaurelia]
MQQKVHLKSLDDACEDPHLHEAIKLFLTMNKDNHTREELYFILQRMEELPYFKQFVAEKLQKGTQRNDILELCSRLRMEYFKGGEVLFEENDPSNDKLYIIFYGDVMLMRMKKMDQLMTLQRQNSEAAPQIQNQQQQFKISTILHAKRLTHKIVKHHNHHKESCINQEEKKRLEQSYGECMRILGEGNGFGEKALAENIPRTLTVACYSLESFIVVLKKDDFLTYQMTFEKTKKEKQQLMFNIFKNVNNEYSSQRLESMIYSCQTIQYDRATQLTSEDESGDSFYIIISGDVTVYKRVDNKNIPLCIVSQGHLLGEEIVINKSANYEFTSQVTSLQALVIVIDSQEFIHKFPEECRIQLEHDYKQKSRNRQNLVKLLCQKKKIDTITNGVQKDQILKLAEIDNYYVSNRTSFNSAKKSDLKLNSNFLMVYSNPSVQNYCIQSIVEKEKVFSSIQLNLNPINNNQNEPSEFNLGNLSKDYLKRRKILFQSKLNQKLPLQNFLKPSSRVLPMSIKRDVFRNYKSNKNRINFHSSVNIFNYASPVSQNKSNSKFIQYDCRESSTNIYTQFDDKQSI